MINVLEQHIGQYVQLSESEKKLLQKYFTTTRVKKKEFLLEEGKICKDHFFVAKGCLRMFFINNKGAEQIVQFAIENWWITDYMAFDKQMASQFSIQAVESSEIISLNASSQLHLFQEIPKMEGYFRQIFQKAYAASLYRMKYLYDFSREELFYHFSAAFPEFVQRVPQYMLASFLGFSPEYLSELRSKRNDILS